jgi:Glycosyl hydrolases family 39
MQIATPRARLFLCVGVLISIFIVPGALSQDNTAHLAGPQNPVPADYFGMHFHRLGGATPWPSVPVATWRLWDAHTAWPDLEPRKGQWHFQTLDAYLAIVAAHHADVLLPLALSPQWASARPSERSTYGPGQAAEPEHIDDWNRYVATVAAHCKGRVHAYEIWNEPNFKSFWTGDVSQMVALTREASETIRRIDPQALIVSPSATTAAGVQWLGQFLAAGGGRYVDVIGFHFYVAPQPPEAMVPLIHQVQATMRDNGLADKPLWDTEANWPQPKPFPSEDLGAAYLARAYILNWAAGVKRLYWYAWDNHGWVAIETTRADNQTLTPAGRAYGIIQAWLVGQRLDSCDEDASQFWTCRLENGGVPEWIVWNPGGEQPFSVPASWGIKTVTPLLEASHALPGPSIEAGPVPELLTVSN